ncbi:MAG: hypothetical protein RLZZ76_554 [Candidatus Parcubacteria bacterium]|jgi:hypothetical protein
MAKIIFKEVFLFGANPDHFNRLFAKQRYKGAADAVLGGFTKIVRAFCPEREYELIRKEMLSHGVEPDSIQFHKTLHTTYYNAVEMGQIRAKLDLREHEVCVSSNVYHGRASYFANARHDFKSVFIPSEAFTFARVNEDERMVLLEEMCKEYGDGPLTRLIIDDVKGIGTDLAGEYKTPPQPHE